MAKREKGHRMAEERRHGQVHLPHTQVESKKLAKRERGGAVEKVLISGGRGDTPLDWKSNPPVPPCQGGKSDAPRRGGGRKAPLTRGVGGLHGSGRRGFFNRPRGANVCVPMILGFDAFTPRPGGGVAEAEPMAMADAVGGMSIGHKNTPHGGFFGLRPRLADSPSRGE